MAPDFKTVSEIVTKYANEVRQQLPVSKVVLFGSYAKGTANDFSDVDVCFFIYNLDGPNSHDIIRKIFRILRNFLDICIEPIILDDNDLYNDNPFVKEILRTGIEIKQYN